MRKGKLFAAIDIGSYELMLKIYSFGATNKFKIIDIMTHKLDIGSDSYNTGKISRDKLDELCRILKEFLRCMETYKVTEYMAYGTSAIREIENTEMVLDQIQLRTGIYIRVLSNSEQRFLHYKAIETKGISSGSIFDNESLIADFGGGSIQLSLFKKEVLFATSNMKLGILRIQDSLDRLNCPINKRAGIITEIIDTQLQVFKKLHLKDRGIVNLIILDDYISALITKVNAGGERQGYISANEYNELLHYIINNSKVDISKRFNISDLNLDLIRISGVMLDNIIKLTGAINIWAPRVSLCDGMAYEYAEKNKIFPIKHNFEQDMVECAINLSKRYMGNKKRSETLEHISTEIFDSLKRFHGLGNRERLLLRIASILHDCGKYISLLNLAECSYNIIMSTEIIGLSHKEREIVANVVKYNHVDFEYFNTEERIANLDKETYLTIAKLVAILRIANGLDRSHKQKFNHLKVAVKDSDLIISVYTDEDITLEKGLINNRSDFFEEVFSIRPVIKQKKTF